MPPAIRTTNPTHMKNIILSIALLLSVLLFAQSGKLPSVTV